MTTKTVQHTPGPWTTSRDAVPDWHTQFTVCAESDGERVATVFRNEANAPLIAAAPRPFEPRCTRSASAFAAHAASSVR